MNNLVGEKLGNYRLARLLGSGGFAEVYLGEHLYLKTQAAIKVLRASLDDEALAQFLTEARIIAHLDHPNIVRTLEFGVQFSTAYLVMSYAPHGTVLRRYPRGTVVPLHIIIEYVRQIADALQYAHAHELIHRDVKPENMLLGRDGRILLSDFGLAMLSPGLLSKRPTDQAGTIGYMAPEQIEGLPGKGSDQYALGVVVYEWLCGHLPFSGPDQEIAIQHLQAAPPSLSQQTPSVPSEIEQVVMKALAKDPSQRFLSVLHFAQVLEEAYQPHKLVRSLDSAAHVQSVDSGDTSFQHKIRSIGAAEPCSDLPSAVVLDDHDNDTMMSSAQNRPTMQATPEPSAHPAPRVSRRIMLAGLAGLAAVSAVGAGAIWSLRDLRFSASSSHRSSNSVQLSKAFQETPVTTASPTSGASTPPHTAGTTHTKTAQNASSAPGSSSAPTTKPTSQVTSRAKTSSPSTSRTNTSPSAPTTNTSPANTTYTTPSTSPANTPANATPTSTPTPTPSPTPTPQPQPTPPGGDQQDGPGQKNGQGKKD